MTFRTLAVIAAMTLPLTVFANPVQDSYRAAAKQETAMFIDFSATRGEALYRAAIWPSTPICCRRDPGS
jgi:hypothetical protein